MINGDYSVNQRASLFGGVDGIGPVAIVNAEYYIDRRQHGISLDTLINIMQLPYDPEVKSAPIQYFVHEVNDPSGEGIFSSKYHVEDWEQYTGKTVTYTALVRSNRPIYSIINDTIIEEATVSNVYPGNSQWQLLTVTHTVRDAAIKLKCVLGTTDGSTLSNLMSVGDWLEVAQEQLELGDTFTGFEIVDPGTQLARCQRFGVPFNNDRGTEEVLSGGKVGPGILTVVLPVPVTLREAPTLQLKGDYDMVAEVRGNGESESVPFANIEVRRHEPGSVSLKIFTTLPLSEVHAYYVRFTISGNSNLSGKVFLDAEMYQPD